MEREFEHRLTMVEDKVKSNQRRLEQMEKRQDDLEDLTTTVKVLAVREENVESDVKEIKNDVKKLTSKPGQRWEKVVETIITIVVSAFVGFLLAKFGM